MFRPDPHLARHIEDQEGLVSRGQLMASGLTRSQAWQMVRVGRWQGLAPGVYATFTGTISDRARIWSALLDVGEPAAASHRTALWLDGLIDDPPAVIRIAVPANRCPRPRAGVRLVRRRDFDQVVRTAANPPRIRLEASLLDVCAETRSADTVLRLVFAATQGRFTTAQRLRAELQRRQRYPWRDLLLEVLSEVTQGVASALELRYVRDVERPHGLPRGERNLGETTQGSSLYRDVRYSEYGSLVELDGRGAHPDSLRFRDWRRDNTATLSDLDTLRYGWHDIVGVPCDVGLQVATLLMKHGWPGPFRQCRRCAPST